MKTVIRTVVASAALGLTVQAADFLSLGDNAEIFLTGTVGLRADDNVLLGSDKTKDVITEFTPGAELVFGSKSLTKGRMFVKETMNFYASEDDLDTSLTSVGLSTNYDDQKMKMNFDTSWEQSAQNTVDVRAGFLVRRDVFRLGGGSEISVTEKSSVAAAINYESINYKRLGFDDSQITTVPINYYFKMTPKMDTSFGIRFRDTELDKGVDSKDYFYNVGFRGEFTPKLSGTVAVGLTTRDFAQGSNENALGVDSSLTYASSEKTSVRFGFTNDFGVSGQGASQRNTSFNVGVQSKTSEEWTLGANLAYRMIHYFGASSRTDKYLEGNLTATYVVSEVSNITMGYTYRNNSSELAGGSFNNSVFSLAANFRY